MTDSSPTSPSALDFLWRRVLELAARGRFSVSPNPRVGCVVVNADGAVVGEGWHERAGGAHAEAVALKAAGERARGATLLVNLEPCSHFGRTPPCTEAILASGVARVVCSVEDPDPRISGRGVRRLRDHGVEVLTGAFAAEAERVNEPFLVSARERRPFVHLKWASSLDGKTATRTGESQWISGEIARRDALLLREEHDAILVGAGTVLADDPLLTRRLALSTAIVPHRRIVLDGALRVAASARVFSAAGGEVWLATAVPERDPRLAAFRDRGVHVVSKPGPGGGVDLAALLADLHAAEARSLLVEGGGVTAAAFLAAGLVDRVTAYLAPKILGGVEARVPVAGEGAGSILEAISLTEMEVVRVGGDIRLSARRRPVA
ncbi:MAG TPA: bifunctional diaminohydroxyphosphoribosylaminopyrimidine deaminase/5-amino-6-(5-phosphoribosylamino)uracil reductase RibD [Thermoanaerobaculia bacterium]|nr:bifunctional diaminohydroxyphosphoribosylaminopyrimidine deaminase/5-amino-6-(5-phosphoribosylamino)uracil reductase RibD [Thermoanaerobaculia bacterium]